MVDQPSKKTTRELRKCVILRCSDSEASMLEEDVYELGRDNTMPLSMERSPGEYVAMWARQASA